MAKAGIMIVEDELIVCEDLKTHLQTLGYDIVATADSAEEAIVKAEKSKPDIVLMDIQLSGSMDGIEAADIIRSRWNIPIVFLTAYDNDDNLKRARHTLPFGYLLKPVQERELKVAIEMALFAAKTESERKQAEEALRQSEEKYRTLAENLPDFISRYDHSGRHVYVSPNIVRTTGKSVEEFMGKTHDELEYPGEQAALWDQQVRDLFETGEPQELDFFYEGPQGIRWLNWRLVPEYDALGNVVYALGITRDDTDRKQTEEKAQRQGEFLVRVTNSLVHPFYIIDAETYEILYANEASRKNKPLGETPKCYELLHRRSEPCQEAGRVCPLDRVRQTQEAVSTEHIDYDKGGNPRNIEIHASPIFDDDGNVIQIIMNAIDITKRRQAEEKRRQLEDQLRHSQKMDSLGTLASGMAHEFNNLLHMMLGNANLIRKKLSANSPLLKNTSNIQEAGKRAADLIKQVLTFGRKDDATLSTINMTPIIKEVSQLLRSTIPTTIRIDTKIAVERGWVEGNATQIQQVIINICKNAEHAMKNCGNLEIGLDKVVLSIKQAGVLNLDPGLHLRLRIQDTGCGIPEENIERIFDPFFTTKGMEKGTGLGLSVVHGIVEKHRGSIQVESEIDKGTTVTIFFPFAETAEEKPREEVEEEYKGEGQKILFVDDEKMIVELMKSQLKALGYSVVATTDSKEALSLFKKGDFDLLITDQEMPDISGLELVEEVRKTDPDLPVILITGRSPKVDKEFMEKLGCIHVLKPVSISDTSKHIRDILKG